MSRYAADTSISTEASRLEIERTLKRYGAEQFIYGWDGNTSVIGFRIASRQVRMTLPMPAPDDAAFSRTPSGRTRTAASSREAHQQACRQRWRALVLVIKAKLEAVECGITSIESEFLANITLPDGRTFGQWAAPQLAAAYEDGRMPPLLPAG